MQTLHVRDGDLYLYYQIETSDDDPAPVLLRVSSLIGDSSADSLSTLTSEGAYKACHYRLPFFDHWIVCDTPSTHASSLHFGIPPRAEKLFTFMKPLAEPMCMLGQSESGLLSLFGFSKDIFLYRFRPSNDPPACTEHLLSLPGSVRIPDGCARSHLACCVLIDEHLGILYVCDREAISACYYA